MIMPVPVILAALVIMPGVIPVILASPVIVSGAVPVILASPVIVSGAVPLFVPFPHPPRMARNSRCSTSTSATSVLLRTPRTAQSRHDHRTVARRPDRSSFARVSPRIVREKRNRDTEVGGPAASWADLRRQPMRDGDRLAVPETVGRMARAAAAFLAALTAAQREKASFAFGDERRDWSFLPARDRDGLPIGALDDGQRRLAHELIVTGTSMAGYAKVVSVMAMEHVLRALTPTSAELFDPERYCFKVFGAPGEVTWGWQLAGHHVSLNFTVADGRYVSPTPCLLGAEPASYGTLAPLADYEELGYRFVNSLEAAQRRAAIIYHRSPPDLATRTVPRIGEVERPDPVFGPEPDYVLSEEERDILSYVRHGPKGVAGSALSDRQLEELGALVGAFTRRLPDEVAGVQLWEIERTGTDNLSFAWAGSTEPGHRHYFRIQGPRLLIEHDNTQGNGNHIHSVWRNPADDFGDDVLAEHYRLHHAGHGG
jgi:hypothetical protein